MDYSDLLGKKFEYGATGPDAFDCWGLVKEIYLRNRIVLPDYRSSCTPEEQHAGFADGLRHYEKVEGRPRALDLVLFCIRPPWVSHVGVVVDQYGNFLHIMSSCSVACERLDSVTWAHRVRGIYRFKGMQ